MESIKAWLASGKNYTAGVKIYLHFGTDQLLKQSFQEGESAFKKRKLEAALKSLLSDDDTAKINTKKKEDVAVAKMQPAQMIRGWPDKMDSVLVALYNEWRGLFMDLQDLCTRLHDTALAGESSQVKLLEAGQMCFKIIRLDEALDVIYSKRDVYIKTGQLPDDPPPVEMVTDPAHQWRAYNNVMRYICHYKKKIEKAPHKVQFLQQLKKYELARDEYRKILHL